MNLTIGKLAKLTGLTVRALHYYEQIGLLSPASREGNGYRVYGEADVKVLQQISVLKTLGFGLEQIKVYLKNPKFALPKLIPMQVEALKKKIIQEEILVKKLNAMEYYGNNKSPVSLEEFFKLMNQVKNLNADLSEEEWKVVKAQGAKLGDAHIRAVEAEWPELIKKVQGLIKNNVDPKSAEAQKAAKRWMELVKEFTGGHKGVEQKVGNMYKQNAAQIVIGDPNGANMAECMNYIQKSLK